MNILVANIGSTSFKYQFAEQRSPVLPGSRAALNESGNPMGIAPTTSTAIERCIA